MELEAGSEHSVYVDAATRRVLKVTHADRHGDGVVGQSMSVLDYLTGLQLQNEAFGDDIRLEGLVEDEGELPRVVISQPFVKGRPATQPEIEAFMEQRGFVKHKGSWYNAESKLRVTDAVPNNVRAYAVNGGVQVVTIDVQVSREGAPELAS